MLLYLATNFSEKGSYFRIAQNSWLREISSDMPLRQRHLLCLKVQCNPSDLFTIALQALFSQLLAIRRETLSNRMAGGSIDLVQGRWLIAEPQPHFLERRRRVFCAARCLL